MKMDGRLTHHQTKPAGRGGADAGERVSGAGERPGDFAGAQQDRSPRRGARAHPGRDRAGGCGAVWEGGADGIDGDDQFIIWVQILTPTNQSTTAPHGTHDRRWGWTAARWCWPRPSRASGSRTSWSKSWPRSRPRYEPIFGGRLYSHSDAPQKPPLTLPYHHHTDPLALQAPPTGGPLKALIFDSYYDAYRGVVVYFRVMDGEIRPKVRPSVHSFSTWGMGGRGH